MYQIDEVFRDAEFWATFCLLVESILTFFLSLLTELIGAFCGSNRYFFIMCQMFRKCWTVGMHGSIHASPYIIQCCFDWAFIGCMTSMLISGQGPGVPNAVLHLMLSMYHYPPSIACQEALGGATGSYSPHFLHDFHFHHHLVSWSSCVSRKSTSHH